MSVAVETEMQGTQASQGAQAAPAIGTQGFQDPLVDPLAEQAGGDDGSVQFHLLNDKTTENLH